MRGPVRRRNVLRAVGLAGVGFAGATGASAQSLGSVTISVEPSTVTIEGGETETVDLVVSGATQGFSAYKFGLDIDPEKVTLVDFTEFYGGASNSRINGEGDLVLNTSLGTQSESDSEARLARVTIRGEREGSAALELTKLKGAQWAVANENLDGDSVIYDPSLLKGGTAEVTSTSAAPEASFTVDPAAPTAGEGVSVDASDSAGEIDSYEWAFGDGETTTTAEPTTTHIYDEAGEYDVTLTASGPEGSDTTTQTVTVQESGPTASFTVDPTTPQVAASVTFDASASTGQIDEYEWTFGDGETVTTTDPTTSRSYDQAGEYDVTLTVRGPEETDTTTKTVSVQQATVEASFTADPSSADPGEQVEFDASNSTGDIESYDWDFDDGTGEEGSDSTVVTSYSDTGVYDVTLTVSGPGAATDTTTTTVVVSEGGLTASFEVDPELPETGEVVEFDATVSTGDIISYEWRFGDGTSRSRVGSITTHSYGEAGEYEVTLIIEGPDGAVAQATNTVTVGGDIEAAFSVDPSDPVAGDTVTFDASATTGSVERYRWDFTGDGNADRSSTSPQTSRVYTEPGSRRVELTVEDGAGRQDSTAEVVVVLARLEAAIEADTTTILTGEQVEFDAAGSSIDTNEFEWDFGDGETASTASSRALHSYDQPGSYTVEVTVADGSRTDSATLDVTVLEPLEAAIEADAGTVSTGETVRFDASNSTGDIDGYEWVFGDGETDTTAGPGSSHSYDEPGTYLARVTVSGRLGEELASTEVTVEPREDPDDDSGGSDPGGNGSDDSGGSDPGGNGSDDPDGVDPSGNESDGNESDGTNPDRSSLDGDGSGDADGIGPGFGPGMGLAGLGGMAYLLGRRLLGERPTDSEGRPEEGEDR